MKNVFVDMRTEKTWSARLARRIHFDFSLNPEKKNVTFTLNVCLTLSWVLSLNKRKCRHAIRGFRRDSFRFCFSFVYSQKTWLHMSRSDFTWHRILLYKNNKCYDWFLGRLNDIADWERIGQKIERRVLKYSFKVKIRQKWKNEC